MPLESADPQYIKAVLLQTSNMYYNGNAAIFTSSMPGVGRTLYVLPKMWGAATGRG